MGHPKYPWERANSKLNRDDWCRIHRMRDLLGLTYPVIAGHMGVSPTVVGHIIRAGHPDDIEASGPPRSLHTIIAEQWDREFERRRRKVKPALGEYDKDCYPHTHIRPKDPAHIRCGCGQPVYYDTDGHGVVSAYNYDDARSLHVCGPIEPRRSRILRKGGPRAAPDSQPTTTVNA